jgi:hypothetical protein
MDLKSTFKKVLGIGLLGAAAITNSTAYAAQANVTVDVTLPTVLVMYHYDSITLNILESGLAGFLVGGTATACSGGTDYCDNQPTPATIDVTAVTPTTTVTQAVNDPGLGATAADFVLEDVVGVRALGCTSYTASYGDGGSDAGVTIGPATPLAGIDTELCSFGMTMGDLQFNLDFNSVAAGATTVQAVFDVTVTGV